MSMHKKLLPLFSALVFGTIIPGHANADKFVYAAKFTCGTVTANPPIENEAVAGVYKTSINIHNPQDFEVPFQKKIVVPQREPGIFGIPLPGRITPLTKETLGPDAAQFVDCIVIDGILNLPATRPVEGFVVLEVEFTNPQIQIFLDVVGKYTARGTVPPTSTTFPTPALEIVVYSPTLIKPVLD